jgi:hypothetical protein
MHHNYAVFIHLYKICFQVSSLQPGKACVKVHRRGSATEAEALLFALTNSLSH